MDLNQRERKVDINQMPMEQVDELSRQVGLKIDEICKEASEKINKLLAIYGLPAAKIAISFDKLDKKVAKKTKAPSTRKKKAKAE